MRRQCEDLQKIDVREIDFRHGANWQYPSPDGIAVSIVNDTARVIHGTVDVRVSVERTKCNYSGSRPWFRCPLCDDRRAVLYHDDSGVFGCRRCMRLSYSCEGEDALARLERKRQKLETKLGGVEGRPKWMRRSTFGRLQFEHEMATLSGVILFGRKICRVAQLADEHLETWAG